MITEDLYMFINQPFRIAGIADQIGGYEVLNVTNSVFATYDLKTSVGPVSGPTSSNESSIGFATTAGYLYLFSTSGTGTFQASVPEPSTMTLAAIGILGLQCFRWRPPRTGRRLNGSWAAGRHGSSAPTGIRSALALGSCGRARAGS